MNHTELVKGVIYWDSGDPDVPLQFTGKKEVVYSMNQAVTICTFFPVKTEKNKDWFHLMGVQIRRFCPENNTISCYENSKE